MRNAKVTAAITAAVAAVLAVLGKAFNFGVDTTTQILMRFGYDWGRAAARAPFYFSLHRPDRASGLHRLDRLRGCPPPALEDVEQAERLRQDHPEPRPKP